MRNAIRLALAAMAAAALALAGCETGFKDIAPPTGKGAANGATSKMSFAGPNSGFMAPDIVEPDTGEGGEDPGP